MSTFEQKRGLINLLQLLRFLRHHKVTEGQVQKMVNEVYGVIT